MVIVIIILFCLRSFNHFILICIYLCYRKPRIQRHYEYEPFPEIDRVSTLEWQYNSKPCGISWVWLVWMICEPNGYTNDYKIYLGKHDEMQGQYHWERVVNIYPNHLNGKVTTFSLTGTFHQSHCFKILKLMVFMFVVPLIPIAKDSLMSWRTKLLVVVDIPSNCNMTICLEQHGNMPI